MFRPIRISVGSIHFSPSNTPWHSPNITKVPRKTVWMPRNRKNDKTLEQPCDPGSNFLLHDRRGFGNV
jgi:hypothetical protein